MERERPSRSENKLGDRTDDLDMVTGVGETAGHTHTHTHTHTRTQIYTVS